MPPQNRYKTSEYNYRALIGSLQNYPLNKDENYTPEFVVHACRYFNLKTPYIHLVSLSFDNCLEARSIYLCCLESAC
jgi:hypothetical protein